MFFQVVKRSAQSIVWICFIQQLANEAFSAFHLGMSGIFHKLRKFQCVSHYLIIYFYHVFRINIYEGIFTSKKFIKNSTQRPEISSIRVSLMSEYLGSHVLWRSNKAKSSILVFYHSFASSHINQF